MSRQKLRVDLLTAEELTILAGAKQLDTRDKFSYLTKPDVWPVIIDICESGVRKDIVAECLGMPKSTFSVVYQVIFTMATQNSLIKE